jgi:hypothetical protein
MMKRVKIQLVTSVSDIVSAIITRGWGEHWEMSTTFWPLFQVWSAFRHNTVQDFRSSYVYASHVMSHDRLPQYLHPTLQPILLLNCFFSLSRYLTERTVSQPWSAWQHGRNVSLVWLPHSLSHTRVLCIGMYTQQAAVLLFISTPHEQCDEDSPHNVWHELRYHSWSS